MKSHSTEWENIFANDMMNKGLISNISRRRQWHPTPVLLPGKSHGWRSLVGCSPWGRKESDTTEQLHFHFHALEKEMATYSSVLAWRISGMGEPGGLPSMGSQRVRHDWSNLAAVAAAATDCGSAGKEPTCNVGDLGSILGWEDPLEKGKATHSSILAWRIPWAV